jgi:hypothetical protein
MIMLLRFTVLAFHMTRGGRSRDACPTTAPALHTTRQPRHSPVPSSGTLCLWFLQRFDVVPALFLQQPPVPFNPLPQFIAQPDTSACSGRVNAIGPVFELLTEPVGIQNDMADDYTRCYRNRFNRDVTFK